MFLFNRSTIFCYIIVQRFYQVKQKLPTPSSQQKVVALLMDGHQFALRLAFNLKPYIMSNLLFKTRNAGFYFYRGHTFYVCHNKLINNCGIW